MFTPLFIGVISMKKKKGQTFVRISTVNLLMELFTSHGSEYVTLRDSTNPMKLIYHH